MQASKDVLKHRVQGPGWRIAGTRSYASVSDQTPQSYGQKTSRVVSILAMTKSTMGDLQRSDCDQYLMVLEEGLTIEDTNAMLAALSESVKKVVQSPEDFAPRLTLRIEDEPDVNKTKVTLNVLSQGEKVRKQIVDLIRAFKGIETAGQTVPCEEVCDHMFWGQSKDFLLFYEGTEAYAKMVKAGHIRGLDGHCVPLRKPGGTIKFGTCSNANRRRKYADTASE